MNNNLEALYSSLKRHKPDYSKSINEFEADMQDENNRSALLQSLQRNYPNKFGQKDLATFSAELGIVASPKELALQTQGNMQAPKIEEVIRPEDYAGEGSFYGLSDDELRKQIEDLDAAREAKKDSLRNEQAKRRESFWYRLGEIMNDANHATRGITPVERDQMEIDGVRLGADEEERYNRLTQEQTWRQRQAGSEYEQLGKSLVEARQRLDNIRDADGRDLDTGGAGAYLDKAIKLYQAPSKFGNGNGIKNWASGLGDQLADYDTWTVGVTEMARAINLNALVNKLNDGEELTDGEEAELEAFLLYGMVQDARQKDLSTGYTIGKGTAESIPFMAEMLITAGMGAAAKRGILTMLVKRGNNVAAKRLARIFGDEITGMTTEKILGKKVETVALKEVEQNLVERVGRQVGEDVLMTAFMPTTWAQVNEDAVEEKLSGDKNYSFGDFVRTFAGATIETGTEHWGGKIVDKAIGKVMPLDKIWGKTRWGKILSNDFIQSPFGETGEEYVGALANYIRSFDPAYSEQSNEKLRDEARRMFSIDGFAQTFLTVLPMSLAGGGINVGVVKHHINAYQSSKDELISMLQEYGATNEQAANIVMQIEGADDTKAFTEMLAQTERTLRMEYQKAHPDATEEDIKKQTDKLDKLLGKYYKSAYYLNEASGELRDAYNNLSDEQKRQVESDFAAAITAQIQEAEKRIENANKQEGAAIGVHVDEMPGTQETEQAAETSESGHANEEKQEAPIVSKEKVKGRSVTINVDGVEQQIQFSCTNAVFNEDGSIDYENSSMVYLQDKDGNLITGNHDAMLSALNDGLRLEKQNGDQLLANDKPIVEEPIDEQPVDEQPEAAAVEQKPYPVLEDGTPDFVQMTPEQQVAYAMENGGEEAAAETIQTAIEELTAELDGIGKKKGLIPA
ncbi:MAG: hypothetical protein IJT89_12505, partial [Bacteroidaceae bacterium]|nr:hypothetical protein [Bacteroidaceae bacterium]